MERGEPVELHLFAGGVRRVTRWLYAPGNPHQQETVGIGVLPDGRWYVELISRDRPGCRAYPTQEQALDVAGRLMAVRDGWVEVPAAYDARQRPATPGPWEDTGRGWRRPSGSDTAQPDA